MSNEVQKLEGSQVKNPFGGLATAAGSAQGPGTALSQTESQRAMIEVMTSFEVAKRFPRDPNAAMTSILAECSRPSLAEVAVYSYARGGSDITGPSIRLMEAIARGWKNIQFGFKVLERRNGSSSIQAIARDLETNTYIERTFDLRHWRDTKNGGYLLKDERDIYELEANMAQRRVRSCIIGLIPGDVIDAAVEQCELTLRASADTTPEGIKKLTDAYAQFDINVMMIEARIQCKIEAIKPIQVSSLRRIFASLRDGVADSSDFFDMTLADPKAQKNKELAQPDLKAEVEKKKSASKKVEKEEPKAEAKPLEETITTLSKLISEAENAGALEGIWEVEFAKDIATLKESDAVAYKTLHAAVNAKFKEFASQ